MHITVGITGTDYLFANFDSTTSFPFLTVSFF